MQHCYGIYSGGADGSSALHHHCNGGCTRGMLHTLRGCFGKVRTKMMWSSLRTKLGKPEQLLPCIRSAIWHLLSSCNDLKAAVLWWTDLYFHQDKTAKSLVSSAQGCYAVWQLKSLETTFSFIESLLLRSFKVRDLLSLMLSCFIQNFIPYSNTWYCIQNSPWFHQL